MVVTTAAAICDVATLTIGANDGSTRATAAGVATALPAVLDAAAPHLSPHQLESYRGMLERAAALQQVFSLPK